MKEVKMKVKRFEKFRSVQSGRQIRVKSTNLGWYDDQSVIVTLDDTGRTIKETARLVYTDSIRRRYTRT